MTRIARPTLAALSLGLALSLGALPAAQAHRGADDGAPRRAPPPEVYTQECGACHVAYPAGLLPAASWQRLTAGLGKHFGVDASLDAKQTQAVAQWLQAQAGTSRRVSAESPPEDRISRSPWFQRKHHEVSARVWARPAIKSASNCSACHPRAADGDFDEDAVQIPR